MRTWLAYWWWAVGLVALFGLISLGALTAFWSHEYLREYLAVVRTSISQNLGSSLVVGLAAAATLVVFWSWHREEIRIEKMFADPYSKMEAKDYLTQRDGNRRTFAQVLGAVFLLTGLYFQLAQLNATREGQVNDSFTKAIAQLGNDTLPIKLSGIYALEQLTKHPLADHKVIMEILTAYVRTKAPWPVSTTGVQAPRPDITTILTVLARRAPNFGDGQDFPLDLRSTDLRGLKLPPHANLAGVDLREANLSDADLSFVDLSKAKLSNVNMTNAVLYKSILTEAELIGATVIKTNFQEARLNGANFRGTDLGRVQNLTAEQVALAQGVNSATLPWSLPATPAAAPTAIATPSPEQPSIVIKPTDGPEACESKVINKVGSVGSTVTNPEGLDLSESNKVVSWQNIMNDNNPKFVFVFLSGSRRIDSVDKSFQSNWIEADKVGLLRSPYYVFLPGVSVSKQIRTIAQSFKGLSFGPCDLPPALDIEILPNSSADLDSDRLRTNMLRDLHDLLGAMYTAFGRQPIIYTSAAFWSALGNPVGFEQYPLWISSYYTTSPKVAGTWSTYKFWQYNPLRRIAGVDEPVNVSRFNGTAADLKELAVCRNC